MKPLPFRLIIILHIFLLLSCSKDLKINPDIILPEDAGKLEEFAAKEIRKYVYLRTGEILSTGESTIQDVRIGNKIILKTNPSLEEEEFTLKTIVSDSANILEISGGSPKALLYGAYEFAEQLGARFYLDGDVIPDKQIPFKIPHLDIQKKPLFSVRGIQPFHDFPEGPDWWNKEDYKALISQLPKMKMNFIGFHTYPENKNFSGEGPKAEPMVWIGTEDMINTDGSVKKAYPVLHFNTLDHSWGYFPIETGRYSFGASWLYPEDKYGAFYMTGTTPWPHTDEENIRIFNDFGKLQQEVFSFAAGLGVKTCIGTETVLTIPEKVKEYLGNRGINPDSDEAKKMVYRGMFERIKRMHPLDYYWFWTPEHWTWGEVKTEEVAATENDLRIAIEAAREVQAPFALATCGWVIGPPPDRAKFDEILPKNLPFSCINRNVGFEEIDESFLRIEDREKWAIPWMEDDPALIIPQLWAGRMRRDAADALSFGCNGLIGIHWRTRELGPNVSALASAAWSQDGWNPAPGEKVTPETLPSFRSVITGGDSTKRDLGTNDFYTDWATAQFGAGHAEEIAEIFSDLDGGPRTLFGKKKLTNLPRPADWFRGPGGLVPDTTDLGDVEKKFDFLRRLEDLRSALEGPGNIERYDWWLNQFRYLRETSHLTCLLGQYGQMKRKTEDLPENYRKEFAENNLSPIRKEEMKTLASIHHHLIQTVTSKGTLGNLTNWQQHVIPFFIEEQGKELAALLGRDLHPDELPGQTTGVTTINILSVPQSLEKGDDFVAEILTLNVQNPSGTIYFKPPEKKNFLSLPVEPVKRGVMKAVIPGILIKYDFEYYIEIKSGEKVERIFPSTAPVLNHMVTIK